MKYLLIIFIGFSISSCKQQGESNSLFSPEDMKQIDTVQKASDNSGAGFPSVPEKTHPIKRFLNLTLYLDSLGYNYDTLRIKEVSIYPELNNSNIALFSSRPFYLISLENHPLFKLGKINFPKKKDFRLEIFRKVDNIVGYFYRKKDKTNWNEDGVIEQWEFTNEIEAQRALKNLESIHPFPYTNTQPFYVQYKNFLFIFHTRAAAFSYTQKEIFQHFKQKL